MEENREVYKKLANLKIETIGSPIVSFIKADGEIIAMHYGFILKNRFLYQIPAFDLKYISKQPGTALFLKMLEYNVSNDMEIFDMGVGIEPYKLRFMNKVESYYSIVKFKKSINSYINRIGLK